MRSARQFAWIGLAAFAVTGCHQAKTAPLVQTQAPAIQTVKVAPPPDGGNPLSTQSVAPLPSLPATTENVSEHAPKLPPKTHHRKPKPAPAPTSVAAQTVSPPATAPALATRDISPQAAASPAPGTPAAAAAPAPATTIGTLSTGDVSAGAAARRNTVGLIGSTESGLNNIKRTLGAADQQTAGQIRSFLQKAKAALDADDLDGANTLATKAKVLLDELTKE